MKNDIFSLLPNALLPWYAQNKRDLPWRIDRDPYHIWVSEIMLQQTRVEAVKGYYARFLKALPSVFDLAKVDDAQLHKLWEGLGYYNRVRNMKKAAIEIVERYNGVFPTEYSNVFALPGIGAYTAGAICSIAYDQPTPAVDGNVLRVLARLTNDNSVIDSQEFKKLAHRNLGRIYPRQAGDFTQALMELGATICGPNKKPECKVCPCNQFCLGCQCGTADTLPVRKLKNKRRIEQKTVFILNCNGEYALNKRGSKGLLADLWEAPNVPDKMDVATAINYLGERGLRVTDVLRTVERKHVFTHIEWQLCGIYINVEEKNDEYTWMSTEHIANEAALPTAFRQFFEGLENV